jgi:hypothetical protein
MEKNKLLLKHFLRKHCRIAGLRFNFLLSYSFRAWFLNMASVYVPFRHKQL